MAKKTFDSLSPKTKVKKASNDKIDELFSEPESQVSNSKKQKSIQFNVKLPENVYNALEIQANKTGLSKKTIVVQALLEKLGLDK